MKVAFPLQIAQSPEEGIGLLQTIISGGPALILAVLVVILGYFAYHQLKANGLLEKGFREKIEELLREMLGRDRDAQEATTAAVQVVEGFTEAMKEQRIACDQTSRVVETNSRTLDDIKRLIESQNATLQAQAERLRALEDEVRRGRSA